MHLGKPRKLGGDYFGVDVNAQVPLERLDLRDCDALVLSASVQRRSLSVIEEVERRSGLPTLSAATAMTWASLRALDLEPVVPGAGALLGPAPEPAASVDIAAGVRCSR